MTSVLVVAIDKTEVLDIDITLPNLRALLSNGYLEAIYGWHPNGEWTCYLDEEGKLKGLPLNEKATVLAAQAGWPGAMVDVLCGTAIFLGPADDEGYDTDVPEWLINEARSVGIVRDLRSARQGPTSGPPNPADSPH